VTERERVLKKMDGRRERMEERKRERKRLCERERERG
jgi:hypothetical protein